jgi:hypothetical protein
LNRLDLGSNADLLAKVTGIAPKGLFMSIGTRRDGSTAKAPGWL